MISIIIPTYKEEKRIENTIKNYYEFFKNKIGFEILVVINNTNDGTEGIVKKYAEKYKEIRYLDFPQKGKGFAIIEGFKDVLKRDNDLIGFVDADMSTKPEDYYDLVKNIGSYDGIIASRMIRGAQIEKSWKRIIISFIFNHLVKMLFFLPYYDTQCGAKLFKRKTIEKVVEELTQDGWIFDVDLLYQLKKKKLKIKEYPTIWEDKEGGSIKLFGTSFEMLCDLIRMRIETFK